jgi:hypothetical protein
MTDTSRRTFLKVLGAGAAAGVAAQLPMQALADPPSGANEFFIFIHAAGAWDMTVGLDPRNEARGIIEPAHDDVLDTNGLLHWRPVPLNADSNTFEIVRPSGSNITFGPAIGLLAEHFDRLCVVRGVATNTVSHPDGTVFASTGRHLAGGRAPESSIDTLIANEFGRDALFPAISMNYPSWFVGTHLDRRAMPLRTGSIETIGKSLARSELYTYAADRAQVTALLSQEARDLAARQQFPEMFNGMGLHYDALNRMLQGNLRANFDGAMLAAAYPSLVPTAPGERYRFFQTGAINAAFAVEAMKRNIVRSVAFSVGSFDTHSTNYRNQAHLQQDLFNILARLIRVLEAPDARHPTLMGERLIDHTHILVTSEFCRTPQINASNGRDHYPCGATLIISPRFRGNYTIGSADPDQMLPVATRMFTDGRRAIAPPDILATFLHAFGVDPRRYMRDGEPVREMLRATT